MLEMGGKGPILGYRRPTVRQHLALGVARVDHRLDREHHPFLQPWILILPIDIIGYLRFLMQRRADPVSHKLPNYGEAVRVPQTSNRRLPALTLSIASSSESLVTASSFLTCSFGSPTGTVIAESPK
jgi:hypothetical protein